MTAPIATISILCLQMTGRQTKEATRVYGENLYEALKWIGQIPSTPRLPVAVAFSLQGLDARMLGGEAIR
jgi:hypothetical protein